MLPLLLKLVDLLTYVQDLLPRLDHLLGVALALVLLTLQLPFLVLPRPASTFGRRAALLTASLLLILLLSTLLSLVAFNARLALLNLDLELFSPLKRRVRGKLVIAVLVVDKHGQVIVIVEIVLLAVAFLELVRIGHHFPLDGLNHGLFELVQLDLLV